MALPEPPTLFVFPPRGVEFTAAAEGVLRDHAAAFIHYAWLGVAFLIACVSADSAPALEARAGRLGITFAPGPFRLAGSYDDATNRVIMTERAVEPPGGWDIVLDARRAFPGVGPGARVLTARPLLLSAAPKTLIP